MEAKRSSFSAFTIARSSPAFGCVIKKNRIHHLARGGRQAEGYVRYAQDGLDPRDIFLNQPDRLDGFDRAPDVVLIAGSAGENQRIDDNVLGRNPVFRC